MRPSADRSKPRNPRPASAPANAHKTLALTRLYSMARKVCFLKPTLVAAVFFLLALFAFFTTLTSPSVLDTLDRHRTDFSRQNSDISPPNSAVKVYMYDLPRRFTYGVIEQHAVARGGEPVSDKYPGHQHMGEWYLFADLLRPDSERVGSPVVNVSDPDDADLFYVPFFSSLSLVVIPPRIVKGASSDYSDEETQEALMEWLEQQEYWRRNNGVDHVIIAQDPNALYKVVDRIKNAMLIVSDFGRLRPDQGSLVKDIIVPYSHRIRFYDGEIGIEDRKTLLFFMGNRYRKEGGKIRDILFKVLENQKGVIIKHGAQSRESRRAASQGMHTSKFCLHPAGDTPSACRLFDAIVSLCVPVIVSDSIELPFEDVIDYRKIAIFVQSAAAVKPKFLLSFLKKIPAERILEYQKELKKVRRYFDYDNPHGTVNEIWRQVSQKLPLIKLMINRDKRLVKRSLKQPDCFCRYSNQTGSITIF